MSIINESNRKWIVLITASLGFGLIMLDETVVAVALPTIQRDLSMSIVQSHWVINAYLLVIAGFIAVGGKLGDITGYRTLFVSGIIVFGIFSLVAGFAGELNLDTFGKSFPGTGRGCRIPGLHGALGSHFSC